MKPGFSIFVVLLLVSPAAGDPPLLRQAPELASPIQILVGTKPLDVEREGHSAPEVGDFNGDGLRDLLVGQYDQGRLRIYLNTGTNQAPRFDDFAWFVAGDEPGRVQ